MILTIIAFIAVGLSGFVLGAHSMKNKIYKELMGYMDKKSREYARKYEEE